MDLANFIAHGPQTMLTILCKDTTIAHNSEHHGPINHQSLTLLGHKATEYDIITFN